MINSISARLIIGVIITLSLLMGLMVLDVLNKQHKLLTQQATQQAVDVSKVVANNALIPLLNNDLNSLRELVHNTALLSDVDMVFVIDNHGQVKAAVPEVYFGQQLNDEISQRWQSQLFNGSVQQPIQYWHNDAQLDTIVPIRIDQSVVGCTHRSDLPHHSQQAMYHNRMKEQSMLHLDMCVLLNQILLLECYDPLYQL
jgi:sensor histidine kinase regulating citrate/malate metabolism